MLAEVNRDEARAILRAMRQVATAGDRTRLTDTGHRALVSASRVAFRASGFTVEGLPAITPQELARALSSNVQAMWAIRFLAVMALVDGLLD